MCLVLAGVSIRLLSGSDRDDPDAGDSIPFTWTVEWHGDTVLASVFRQSIEELGPPPRIDDWWRWTRERAGVQSGTWKAGTSATSYVTGAQGAAEVVLRAKSAEMPVTLTGIEVDVLDRQEPIVGTKVYHPGGGGKSGRFIIFDADSDPPSITGSSKDPDYNSPTSPPRRMEPMQFPYQITTTDTELFDIWVQTTKYHVTWRMRVRWSTGVASGEVVLDDNGRPFEVSPAGPGSRFCARSGTGWVDGVDPNSLDQNQTTEC
ncbi:hypothetical protein ACIA5E_18075 [Nocardia asteroides]|uniref:hypothetical protein n=1 Tax=Nocardia asteroides TaxID=1824 RepID=UPI0037BD3F86